MTQENKDRNTKQLLEAVPVLADKFLVDAVNGLHVNQDHIRQQKKQNSMIERIGGFLTGSNAKRQQAINANNSKTMEASLAWLGELSKSLAQNHYAVSRVNERLNALKLDIAQLAHYSADTRELLNQLSANVNTRCQQLEAEVVRIGMIQQAQLNLDRTFRHWEAGHYQYFPLAGRCYVVLENLRWGAFGDYQRLGTDDKEKQSFLDDLKNRLLIQLTKDGQYERSERVATQYWLTPPEKAIAATTTWQDALVYLGDETNAETQAFSFSISQRPELLPLKMPRICSAKRLSDALISENFAGVSHV